MYVIDCMSFFTLYVSICDMYGNKFVLCRCMYVFKCGYNKYALSTATCCCFVPKDIRFGMYTSTRINITLHILLLYLGGILATSQCSSSIQLSCHLGWLICLKVYWMDSRSKHAYHTLNGKYLHIYISTIQICVYKQTQSKSYLVSFTVIFTFLDILVCTHTHTHPLRSFSHWYLC